MATSYYYYYYYHYHHEQVPAMYTLSLEKALWLAAHQSTHIKAVRTNDGEIAYFVLSRENSGRYERLSNRLIEMYEAALVGEKEARIQDYDHLVQAGGAIL